MSVLPAPITVDIIFTYRCNLHCPFCDEQPFRREEERRPELTTEEWCRIIDEVSAAHPLQILFTGGEPFIHPGFWQMLDHTVKGNMRFVILSNGTLITKEMAQRLADYKRCDYIQISLDGLEPEHDAIRGKGMFRKAVDAIHYLADAGLQVRVNTVVTPESYTRMPEFAQFLETLPITRYRLNLSNDGKIKDTVPADMFLTIEQLADFLTIMNPLLPQLKKLSPKAGAFAYWDDLLSWEKIQDRTGHSSCSNPWTEASIQPDGLMAPCMTLRDPVFGDLKKSSFLDIWRSEEYEKFRKKIKDGLPLTMPECDGCKYAYYCKRYCPIVCQTKYCRKKLADCLRKRGIEIP